jgi:hypothetical protein
MKCATCQHWKPVAPAYSDDGQCAVIGASYYTQDKTIVLAGNIVPFHDSRAVPAGPRLITDAAFGCVRWESR